MHLLQVLLKLNSSSDLSCSWYKVSLFQGKGEIIIQEFLSPLRVSAMHAYNPDKLQLAVLPVMTGPTGFVRLCYSVNNVNNFQTLSELA